MSVGLVDGYYQLSRLEREIILMDVAIGIVAVGVVVELRALVGVQLILVSIGDELVGLNLRIEVVEIVVRIHHGMIIGEALYRVKRMIQECG